MLTSSIFAFNVSGSSSAPAGNLSKTAPEVAMNLIHSTFAPRLSGPKKYLAVVPASISTQISTRAMDIFIHLARAIATTASAIHTVARKKASDISDSL